MRRNEQKIQVKGNKVTIVKSANEDYILITDIARHKNSASTGLVISHWMSTRCTII